MTPDGFRALLRQHLLPLISGAELLPDTASSPAVRPAVDQRNRHLLEIKPSQDCRWCFRITRPHPFARTSDGPVTEKALARAFVEGLGAMPPGFEASPYAADLMARFGRRLVADTLCPDGVDRPAVLAAIDQLEAWSSRTYEGHPIAAAVGFSTDGPRAASVSLQEAWAGDFSAVLTNAFDTMLVADGNGHLLDYAAMAPPAAPPPLAPVRLGAVAHWCGLHPDRLALVLNRNAELLALRHGQLVFARRAGRWFFLAPEAIVHQMGGPRGGEDLRRAVYASCLDASFAGTGACLGILNKEFSGRLREIAPDVNDHLLPPQSAKARLLHLAINGQPFTALDRRLRQEILAIDGATILDHRGHIVAAGAILKVAGGSSSGGGRRAAAQALSTYGVGIKVSADGGIEGFRRATGSAAPAKGGSQASFRLMLG
jgi:hypothetical protein